MISYEQYCRIKQLKEEGLSPGQIVAKLGFNSRTVRKWMSRSAFQQRLPGMRPSKLDPFKDEIVGLLERHPYSATQIFTRISEEGFKGGYTIVKEYVRKIRPRRQPAYLTLRFAPGECAQVDWGSYKSIAVENTTRRLSFFVMVLCHSRMMYVEFTVSQTMEHFLGCHQRAFEFFGGVPEKVMVDNLKSAVLQRITGQAPVFNPRYQDFSGHYGFRIVPCGVRKGNEKGRVENAVGYIKKNFLNGLEAGDFKLINPAVRLWMDTVANVRIHGVTKKRPLDMFAEEASTLSPLPPFPYDTGMVHQVRASKQFRVILDTNRYSVPAEYAGRRLTMKAYSDRICFYNDNALISRHNRSYGRHQDIEDPDHPKALLQQKRKAREQKILARFLTLSPQAEQYYLGLKERRLNLMHHIRKIVGLSEIYGADKVGRAVEDGYEFRAFSCEYIANLLEQRGRTMDEPGALHITRNEDLLDITLSAPNMNDYGRRNRNA